MEAVGRALTSNNQCAQYLGFEAPTSVDSVLTQAASWARDADPLRRVRGSSVRMTSLIEEFMSAQDNNLSAAQLFDEVADRLGLSSAGAASDSRVATFMGSDANAIPSGSSSVTVAELVEVVDDPSGAPAPSSSGSIPLTRLRSGRRSSILVSLLFSVAFLPFFLPPLYLCASRARRSS